MSRYGTGRNEEQASSFYIAITAYRLPTPILACVTLVGGVGVFSGPSPLIQSYYVVCSQAKIQLLSVIGRCKGRGRVGGDLDLPGLVKCRGCC